jgi:hypothetical protein
MTNNQKGGQPMTYGPIAHVAIEIVEGPDEWQWSVTRVSDCMTVSGVATDEVEAYRAAKKCAATVPEE